MNNKRQCFFVIIIITVLIILLSILLHIREEKMSLNQELLVIAGETRISLSYDVLEDIPLSRIRTLNNGIYKGYLITDIIGQLTLAEQEVNSIYFTARDGSRIIVSYEEIISERIALIPRQDKGKSLRLVFPEDSFRNRWLKDIAAIRIEQ